MYFEIDDIKRRYQPYHDHYNVSNWVDTPDQDFTWDLFRGAVVGTFAMSVQNYYKTLHSSFKAIRTRYNPPESISQVGTYFKAMKQLDTYKPLLKAQLSTAVARGSLDIGLRLAVFRYFTGGLYQSPNTVNVEFWKRIYPTMLGAALTSWILVPFESARAAYLGDLTFPKELRRGYSGQFDAFRKMLVSNPFSLFKNSLPTFGGSFVQTSFLFVLFDFSFDFMSPMFTDFDQPKILVKSVAAFFSSFLAAAFAYPIHVTTRNMIEITPAQISNGIFQNNYRKAFWGLWNFEGGSRAWYGFSNYCHKNLIWMFLTVWWAESFGFFKAFRNDYVNWPGTNETKIFNM